MRYGDTIVICSVRAVINSRDPVEESVTKDEDLISELSSRQ